MWCGVQPLDKIYVWTTFLRFIFTFIQGLPKGNMQIVNFTNESKHDDPKPCKV
jgi:hypothetical protein